MIGRFFSTLSLLLFVLLLLYAGYNIFANVPQAPIARVAQTTLTPTKTNTPIPASPTATRPATATSPPAPVPTATATPTATTTPLPPASPTPTPTPSLSPTVTLTPSPTVGPTPALIVWVQTGSDLNTPPHTLGLISADANNPVMQTFAVAPALSPAADGQLAFYSESSEGGFDTGIWIGQIEGGYIQTARRLSDATDVQNLVWSAGAEGKLAFEVVLNPSRPSQEWQSEIRIILADLTGGYVELDRFDGRHPAWSPDGQKLIFYSCRGSKCGLFLANCTGGNCDEAAGKHLTSDSTDSYPAWGPDGNRVAFASRRDGNQEIYLLQLADGQLVNLTNRPTVDTTPVFSPDGRKIFFRTDFNGVWQIQVIDLASGKIEPFLESVGGDDRDWGLVRLTVR